MLNEISVDLTPELFSILYSMGHGDELVIVDANFPAVSHAKRIYRVTNMDSTNMLNFILSFINIDTFVDNPIALMAVADGDNYNPEAWETYKDIIQEKEGKLHKIEYLAREKFYTRAKDAYAVVATSDMRRYANIIIKKGIIDDRCNK